MATALEWVTDPLATIVVATDFSETAEVALDRAIDLAERHESELALVHVMQPDAPVVASPGMVVIPPDYERLLREASRQALAKKADRARAAGVRVREVLETGRPARAVADAADELGADLVIVGTRGHTGFKHLMLGSIAEEIVRLAKPPVITVHPDDRRSIEPVRKLMLPTDFSPAAVQALGAAVRLLAQTEEAEVLLVHACHLSPTIVPIGGLGDGFVPYFADDAVEIAERTAEPTAERLRERGFRVEVCIERGDPADVVTRLADERDVDIIVMGTRGHSKLRHLILGSTAERVVEHAPCPVMTVHAEENVADDGDA